MRVGSGVGGGPAEGRLKLDEIDGLIGDMLPHDGEVVSEVEFVGVGIVLCGGGHGVSMRLWLGADVLRTKFDHFGGFADAIIGRVAIVSQPFTHCLAVCSFHCTILFERNS